MFQAQCLTIFVFSEFIDRIRQPNQLWCPHKKHQIYVLTCLNPPKKEVLLQYFKDAVRDGFKKKKKFVVENHRGMQNLIEVMEQPTKRPDISWLLLIISAVAGAEHPLFQKGYRPEKIQLLV